jgi:hypothetical protein
MCRPTYSSFSRSNRGLHTDWKHWNVACKNSGVTHITELWGFTNKSNLIGDRNAKHLVWNSKVPKPADLKLLELFVDSNLNISAAQCCTHYTPDERGDVLDTVVYMNMWVSDILDSDHLAVIFSTLSPVGTREALIPVEKLKTGSGFKASPMNSYLQKKKKKTYSLF